MALSRLSALLLVSLRLLLRQRILLCGWCDRGCGDLGRRRLVAPQREHQSVALQPVQPDQHREQHLEPQSRAPRLGTLSRRQRGPALWRSGQGRGTRGLSKQGGCWSTRYRQARRCRQGCRKEGRRSECRRQKSRRIEGCRSESRIESQEWSLKAGFRKGGGRQEGSEQQTGRLKASFAFQASFA